MLKKMKQWGWSKIKRAMIVLFCTIFGCSSVISYLKQELSNKDVHFYEDSLQKVQDSDPATSDDESSQNQETNNIRILNKEETSQADSNVKTSSKKININTADAAQLETLKGIGPTKAQAILDYRNQYGPFVSLEQIMEVQGIGEGTYLKLKDSICIE